ncbi:MAG: hypothetical protein ACRDPF_18420 [Streptosporangiaceae bacterium]
MTDVRPGAAADDERVMNQTNNTGRRRPLTARRPAVAAMIVAAAGIIVQILGGADYPAIPPGAVLLLAAAGLFAIRTRWTPMIGMLIPLFLSVGAVATPNMRDDLGDPSGTVVFAGAVIQLLGLAGGLVLGAVLVRQSLRKERG